MRQGAFGSIVLASALLTACGGDDGGCPTDDCTLKGRTVVKWAFNSYPDRGFAMDSCVDVGATKVQVFVVDSMGGVQSIEEDCGIAQATFSGLEPGDYGVYIMPVDGSGAPLLKEQIAGYVAAGTRDVPTETTVNVPYDAWLGSFTGTFLFRISWSGASCDVATPVIKDQTIKLTVNGVTQAVVTDDGQMMNGTDKKPCKKLTDEFPQSALNVPFGPATFLIQGFDDTGTMSFGTSFDTFVGAGINNPTLTFDVPLM